MAMEAIIRNALLLEIKTRQGNSKTFYNAILYPYGENFTRFVQAGVDPADLANFSKLVGCTGDFMLQQFEYQGKVNYKLVGQVKAAA